MNHDQNTSSYKQRESIRSGLLVLRRLSRHLAFLALSGVLLCWTLSMIDKILVSPMILSSFYYVYIRITLRFTVCRALLLSQSLSFFPSISELRSDRVTKHLLDSHTHRLFHRFVTTLKHIENVVYSCVFHVCLSYFFLVMVCCSAISPWYTNRMGKYLNSKNRNY